MPDRGIGAVVAVINSSPDTIEMLRSVLQRAGFIVVSAYTYDVRDGRVDLASFMHEHSPRAVIYDIAPPYEENWRLFQHIRKAPSMRHGQFVITSTNPARVQALAGKDDWIYEIIDKPHDLDEIVRATKEAVRARAVKPTGESS